MNLTAANEQPVKTTVANQERYSGRQMDESTIKTTATTYPSTTNNQSGEMSPILPGGRNVYKETGMQNAF